MLACSPFQAVAKGSSQGAGAALLREVLLRATLLLLLRVLLLAV
jgi:hypothetical protein